MSSQPSTPARAEDLLRALLITPALIDSAPKNASAALTDMLNQIAQNAATGPFAESGQQPAEYRQMAEAGDLASALAYLDPLVQPSPTRFAFLGTHSNWTVFLTNLSTGDAGGSLALRLTRVLQTRAVQFVSSDDSSGSYAQMFHVYDRGNEQRILEVLQEEDGPYYFRQSGTSFSFEDTSKYAARRKKDRLTRSILLAYLAEMGCHPYDIDFYNVSMDHPAYIVQRIDHDERVRNRFVFTPLSEMRR